jgi:phosphoketolase
MRFLLFLAFLCSPIGLSYVSASWTDKAEGVWSVHHTPHPPHDHHHDDHIKKLDESLKRSREEESWDDTDL